MKSKVGTLDYLSPEVLKGNYDGKAYDMWTIGALTFVILSGETPFYGKTDD
jgi:serine/threonine protein kinase